MKKKYIIDTKQLKRGDVYYMDFGDSVGSEQHGVRPVVILQNNVGNRFSPTTIVASITSRLKATYLPVHILVTERGSGLSLMSIILLEQILTADKARLLQKIGRISEATMSKVDKAVKVSLGLVKDFN